MDKAQIASLNAGKGELLELARTQVCDFLNTSGEYSLC